MGDSVLHEDAIFPVRKEGIPINIRNTNRPEEKGHPDRREHLPQAAIPLRELRARRASVPSTLRKP